MGRIHGFVEKFALAGRTGKVVRDYDDIRSEHPFAVSGISAGFAGTSAGVNLVLSVASNKVFHVEDIFYALLDSIAMKAALLNGGTAASAGATGLVIMDPAQATSGYQNHIKDIKGLWVFSASQSTQLFVSCPASTFIKVTGKLFDYADFE